MRNVLFELTMMTKPYSLSFPQISSNHREWIGLHSQTQEGLTKRDTWSQDSEALRVTPAPSLLAGCSFQSPADTETPGSETKRKTIKQATVLIPTDQVASFRKTLLRS